MSAPTNYDLAKVILDLLTIAEVAMPDHLYDIGPRVHAGRQMLAAIRPSSQRPPSVSRTDQPPMPYLGEADPSDPAAHQIIAALDVFMSEPHPPVTRPEAISLILREWLCWSRVSGARAGTEGRH